LLSATMIEGALSESITGAKAKATDWTRTG
jgi:hypothetical protein